MKLLDWLRGRRAVPEPAPEELPVAAPMASPDAPYRSPQPGAQPPAKAALQPDDELARLADEGNRRAQAMGTQQDAAREKRHEWLRLHRLCDAMALLPDAPAAHVVEAVPAEKELPPGTIFPVQMTPTYTGPPPPEVVAAAVRKAHRESAWLASLPFALERYFAVLAEDPHHRKITQEKFCLSFTIDLVAPGTAPSHEILEGVARAYDVGASLVAARVITIQSGGISCWGEPARQTSERFAPYIHGFVEKVLLPLHRSRAIKRASVECV